MAFRTCPYCETEWRDYNDFLADKDLVIEGYHANIHKPEDGVIVLSHLCESCGGSIGIRVGKLAELYDLTRFDELKFGTDECEGHCETFSDIASCSQDCSMRWVRDTLQMMKNRIPPPGPTPANY